jgi:filamentous hemagglutinin family protein
MIHSKKVTWFRLIGFLAINRMSNHWRMAINVAITLLTFSTILESSTYAQIIPDNSLKDENSTVENVNVDGTPREQIEGGATRGENLFHSFDQFNIGEGQQVYFNSSAGIENILSRVTGGEPSEILGTIGVNGNANLFLINPNGIIFGNNASLDVGGSFVATTASSVIFENNVAFSTENPSSPPLLTISVPIGLQFGATAGSISYRPVASDSDGFALGLLEVPRKETLAFVGGNIAVQGGQLIAPAGSVELGSVSGDSKVSIQPIKTGFAFGYEDVQNFQDIKLTSASETTDSQSYINIVNSNTFEAGGTINLQGRHILLENGSEVVASGANVSVNASEIFELTGTSAAGVSSSLANETAVDNNEGSIRINTERLIIRDGGKISTQASGLFSGDESSISEGSGGNLTVNASESVDIKGKNIIRGEPSGLSSTTSTKGDAGDLEINTKRLILEDDAQILAESAGQDIDGETLTTGKGGDIKIIASDSINLNGGSISSETTGLGEEAGNLSLETGELNVQDGAEISVSTTGSGAAGNLKVLADSINLDHGILSATTTVGEQGNIFLNSNNIFLDNQSRIQTDTNNSTGGNIEINTSNLAASNNSDITARAEKGTGGRVTIDADGIFGIEVREQLTDFNDIVVTSDLGAGFSGEAILRTPDVDPTSSVFELSDIPIDAESLFARDPCAFQGDRIAGGSSFTITGRGGLPPTLEDPLVSSNRVVNWASAEEQVSSDGSVVLLERSEVQTPVKNDNTEIEQAQGWVVSKDGSIYLTADAPQVTPQNSGMNHPACRASL